MLTWIGDGGRAKYELRMATIEIADPAQPPQNTGDIGPENATVDMRFIYNHIFQPAYKSRPELMIGQYSQMQHIRICKNHLPLVAQPPPQVRRSIPVKNSRQNCAPYRKGAAAGNEKHSRYRALADT